MSFLSEISDEDRELLFDLNRHDGMRILLAFIDGRMISVSRKLLDDKTVDTMEKVSEIRGMRKAYRSVHNLFVEIRDYHKKDKEPSGE